MATIDLSQLPAPDVVEVLDYESILAERKATLLSLCYESQREAVARTLQLESEPLTKLLEESAYREVMWRQRVNEAARANMLAYATGGYTPVKASGSNYTDQSTNNYAITVPMHPGQNREDAKNMIREALEERDRQRRTYV